MEKLIKRKAAVFSCLGIGDGLIALVLSNNLNLNGFEVTTFHPSLGKEGGLGPWFPWTAMRPFPAPEELAQFDRIFIPYEKTGAMHSVIEECERKYPERTTIVNPIATAKQDYKYWEGGKFDGRHPFSLNLKWFCERELGLERATQECGIVVPAGLAPGKHARRVVIHPTSSREGKNWLKVRYETLARRLQREGYEPVFILGPGESAGWEAWNPPGFTGLGEMAAFVAESGAMIGNDSGIGHLASALGLPTVILCRARMAGRFWRPAWSRGVVLYPPAWVPNLKGMRLRDKYWKELISVGQVMRAFKGAVEVG